MQTALDAAQNGQQALLRKLLHRRPGQLSVQRHIRRAPSQGDVQQLASIEVIQ